MAKPYTREQFWKLYEKLPKELQDALFAEETGDNIYNVCKKNEVEENLGEIVDYVGAVLVGLLPQEDFQKTLEKELNLKEEIAKKVAQEINRFIFYPVRPALEELYRSVSAPAEKIVEKSAIEEKLATEEKPMPEKPEMKPETLEEEIEEKEKPIKQDTYREPIE